VLVDNASYLKLQQVRNCIEEMPIEVTYFPRGSPDLNPVEECWWRLKQTFDNRFFNSIDNFRPYRTAVFD